MNYLQPERLEALTHRYVLGTMSRRARRRFGRLVDESRAAEDAVLRLESQLLPMAWQLDPVQPSALLWPRIARRLHAPMPAKQAESGGWRLAAGALALAVLATTLGWWQTAQRTRTVVVETVVTDPATGIIAGDDGSAIWYVRLIDADKRARVSVQSPPDATTANDYQLWVLRDDGVPVSLGLLPQTGSVTLALSDEAVDGIRRGTALAVSLEPPGGSPEPVPTGPVLYTAAIVGI